ncbi:MAG: D-alanyl-D-alanine carboxypeptidase [Gammaproteobacteria bacterium]|nr:D-alanyl-D-alanine carboxypeptidase [Gammaproteobacteria bacterium]
MTKRLLFRICLPFLACLLLAGQASSVSLPVPKPPAIGAEAYLLQDFHSGQVLAEKNIDERMEPASITKIMTAYAVFKEIQGGQLALDDMVRVSEKAWRTQGSRMFIEVGKQVSVEDLLQGLIVQSGNDASVALAEHVAGSEDAFAGLMNRYARELGMTGTNFVNSYGWPHEQHYTTARDIAILARHLIEEFPEHYHWYAQRQFTFNGITQHNRNRLLWRDASVDGLKTGHTDSAGYCLVTSAQRDGMRLITVVLGTRSEEARAVASQSLLNYGFRFFETHKLYEAGNALTQARVWKGALEQAPLGLGEDLFVTIPRGQYDRLDASMTLDSRILAPVQNGQTLGNVHVRLGEHLVAERPLLALAGVEEGSFWQRLVDEARLYFD